MATHLDVIPHFSDCKRVNYGVGGVNVVIQTPLGANLDTRGGVPGVGCVGVCNGKKRRFIATSHETPRSPRAVKEIDHIANRYFLLNFNQDGILIEIIFTLCCSCTEKEVGDYYQGKPASQSGF